MSSAKRATILPIRRSPGPDPKSSSEATETPIQDKLPGDGGTGASNDAATRDAPHPGFLRRPAAAGIGLAGLLAVTAATGLYLDHAGRFESTDDAFITARQFAVAPKVPGYLTEVAVTDNQHVAAGDVIARVDDRDYRVSLAQAEAQVAAAQAGIANIDAQIEVQDAQITASEAQVKLSRARLVYARQEAERYGTLTKEGWSSQQTGELAASELYQQQAAVSSAQANLAVAHRQVDALKAQRASASASLQQAEARRDQARLDLSYATVVAAQPGRVVQLGAAVGQLAQAGTGLAMFVPDRIWVTANFKETQLHALRPGQAATFRIDAYPERTIHGRVASVQPGSGTAFSLLPAENATGNYVKIVQRVPVKIVIDDPPTDIALGPGMSVVPTVRTDPAPSLYERLRSWL